VKEGENFELTCSIIHPARVREEMGRCGSIEGYFDNPFNGGLLLTTLDLKL